MNIKKSDPSESRRRYWRLTKLLTTVLLMLWFLVSFVVSYFARDLNFTFFGWPFSFWMGAQGTLMVFGFIIGFYAWAMNRLDRAHGQNEESD